MATGPAAFTAAMQALGSLYFLDELKGRQPADTLGDPAGCMNGAYKQHDLHALVLRHLRCARLLLVCVHARCSTCNVYRDCAA